ncbi:DUF5698 domain-containing protein [Thermovirga sp.]|uniref:DUF5698 domain-containing protein n=1 Tax=Thermovirga sp. TaxID=2699834 RepID=UPI0025EC0B1A|nr:DUF5698 domain-containing protein [Thermovirga sp.]MBO8153733.1 hypothetical protein [Thermovirga sp.]
MDIVGPLLIFCSRLLDVPLGTFRILLLVRGNKFQASIMAFFESAIYLIALGYILKSGINEPAQIIAYAAGYAAGNFLGVTLEEKFLNSFVLIEIIIADTEEASQLITKLRSEGFGTTVLYGSGKEGRRIILKVLCRRDEIQHLYSITGNSGVVFVSDVKGVWGGHFRQKRK